MREVKIICDNCKEDVEKNKKNYFELNIMTYLGDDFFTEALSDETPTTEIGIDPIFHFCNSACLVEYVSKKTLEQMECER